MDGGYWGLIIFLNIIWVILCCCIAAGKNRSVAGWLFGGIFLGLIGVIIVACLPKIEEPKPVQHISTADEIIKYKKLLDDGVITQEEFEEKKKELLNM